MSIESVLKRAEELSEMLRTDIDRYEDDLLRMLQIGVYYIAVENVVDELRELMPQRRTMRPRRLTLVK